MKVAKDCPVPSAILKTLQVLVGAAVEQEVHIKITVAEREYMQDI